jgi:hypothetical protein
MFLIYIFFFLLLLFLTIYYIIYVYIFFCVCFFFFVKKINMIHNSFYNKNEKDFSLFIKKSKYLP